MSFVSKAFGGGQQQQQQLAAVAAQQDQQAAAAAQLREENRIQAEAVAKREADTATAEAAQRKVRSGARRGLLAYTDAADPVLGGR